MANHSNHPTTWTSARDEALVRLRSAGRQWVDIARELGTTDSTARRRYLKLQEKPPQQAVESMQASSVEARLNRLERENAALRAKLEPRRLPVEQEHEAEIGDIGEYWRRCEEKAKADIERANTRGQFRVVLDNDVIGISFVSDQHIGPGTPVDFERMRLDAELIAATPGLYGILGGDLADNHIKHRAAIMAARSQPSDQWRLAEYYLNIFAEKIIVTTSGNHDCLHPDVELLTRRGWIRYTDIVESDEVLGINPATERAEWQRIERVIVRESDGHINNFTTRSFSVACTDRHRIFHKHRRFHAHESEFEFSWQHAQEFTYGRRLIPVSGRIENPGVEWSDDEIRLAAWVLTDGWICKTNHFVRIAQRRSKVWKPQSVLDRLGYEYTLKERHRDIKSICGVALKSAEVQCELWLRASASKQVLRYLPSKASLPEWVWSMDSRQFSVFLESLIDGDGSPASTSHTAWFLYGTHKFLSEVQRLCVQHGHSAGMSEYRPNTWRLNICKRLFHQVDVLPGKWERIEYVGPVWCLTVPHSNFAVRHQGKVHFTGNSWSDEIAGVSVLEMVCRAQRVCYAPDEARIAISCGDQTYRVAMRHQFRMNSSFNQTHAVLQWLRLGEDEFDIGAVGHHHEAAISQNVYRGQPVISVRPGSYQITSAYSRRYGYNRSIPTCPTVLLWPGERRMMPFWNVRDAAEVLKQLRGIP